MRYHPIAAACAALFVVGGLWQMAYADSTPSDARVEFFEKKVRPILVGHCYTCHAADTNAKGGLRVDDCNGQQCGSPDRPSMPSTFD
jgi:hypothetical protein